DHDHRPVATGVPHQRETDAGVACGALDDHATRPQLAACLGVAHDVERRAILDRAARVHELGLAEDRATGQFGGPAQLDDRRIADRLDEAITHVHDTSSIVGHPGAKPADAGIRSLAEASFHSAGWRMLGNSSAISLRLTSASYQQTSPIGSSSVFLCVPSQK